MGTTYSELPLLTELAKAYVKKAQLKEQYLAEESGKTQCEILEKMREIKETIDSLIIQWDKDNPEPDDLIEGTLLIHLDKYHEDKDESYSRLLEADINEWYKQKYIDYDYEGQPEGLWFYNFPKVMIDGLRKDIHSLNSQWLPEPDKVKWDFDRELKCPFFGNLKDATDYLEAYGLLEGQKVIKVKKEMFIKNDEGKEQEVICTIEVEVPIPSHMVGDEDYEKYRVYRHLDNIRRQMIKKNIGFNIIFPNGDFGE